MGSPKKAFSVAMQNGWIDPAFEDRWMQMIKDRNLTTHTYEESLAKQILVNVQEQYVDMFGVLLQRLENKEAA